MHLSLLATSNTPYRNEPIFTECIAHVCGRSVNARWSIKSGSLCLTVTLLIFTDFYDVFITNEPLSVIIAELHVSPKCVQTLHTGNKIEKITHWLSHKAAKMLTKHFTK